MFPSLVSLKSASLAPGGTGLSQKANLLVPQEYSCAVPPVGPTSRAVEYPGSQDPLTPSFPVAAAVHHILVDYVNVDINPQTRSGLRGPS